MAERQLDVLEERIEQLENLVFGAANKDSIYPKVMIEYAILNRLSTSITHQSPKTSLSLLWKTYIT